MSMGAAELMLRLPRACPELALEARDAYAAIRGEFEMLASED
jgi:hypothetical protein